AHQDLGVADRIAGEQKLHQSCRRIYTTLSCPKTLYPRTQTPYSLILAQLLREAWYRPRGRYGWNNSQTKGRATGSPAWSHPAVGADISVSEVPADAVPGVGSGHGTLERSRNKRLRIVTGEG